MDADEDEIETGEASDPEVNARPGLGRRILRFASFFLWGVLSVIVLIVLISAWASRRMPPLETWHRDAPDGEFRDDDYTDATTLEEYLAIEETVMAQLKRFEIPAKDANEYRWAGRFIQGGRLNPTTFEHNWNRTTILEPEGGAPLRGGALLIHGASDSPYSLRRVGKALQSQGYYVVCLRLPGHGTVPAALLDVDWDDWFAALKVGARHVAEKVGPDRPFVVGGFSLGGALVLNYAIESLRQEALRPPDRIFLFAGAIGVNPFARLTHLTTALSWIPAFEKSKWLSIQPEFDPYKYNSFTKHTGFETWRLTVRNLREGTLLTKGARAEQAPPFTAFQSAVDTTVMNAYLLKLFGDLPDNGSEMVLFDINRLPRLERFFTVDVELPNRLLLSEEAHPYDLTLVTNRNADTFETEARHRNSGEAAVDVDALDIPWPREILCLSHSAIPFAPDDPFYGNGEGRDVDDEMIIGNLVLRSERGVLAISDETLMRLRFNPFYDYLEKRLIRSLPVKP